MTTNQSRPNMRLGKSVRRAPNDNALRLDHGECHVRELLDRIGDKWTVHVIVLLAKAGTLRFSDLRRRAEGISQRMLTVTLRGLERDGLVARTVHPEVPPRVEYTLTPLGETVRDIVRSLMDWSSAHVADVAAARARYDALARESADRAAL
jgi:DNA-binding HxlR family transcriptional regulator